MEATGFLANPQSLYEETALAAEVDAAMVLLENLYTAMVATARKERRNDGGD